MVKNDGSDVFWRLWHKNIALSKRIDYLGKKSVPWQKMRAWEVSLRLK